MRDSGKNLPVSTFYVYVYKQPGGLGSGLIESRSKLGGAGIVRQAGNGRFLDLTEEGKRFADWLIKRGRKCDYFWTEEGGWGTPEQGSREEHLDSTGKRTGQEVATRQRAQPDAVGAPPG